MAEKPPSTDNVALAAAKAGLRRLDEFDAMPRPELVESDWSPEQRAVYLRGQRMRNWMLLAAMGGFCLLIYAIAIVKLHEYGQMW
ncbi:MAG: hypothetical protein POH28_15345 [Acidocella sp.]|nr:hypothetical protein [Acidocella sp.]